MLVPSCGDALRSDLVTPREALDFFVDTVDEELCDPFRLDAAKKTLKSLVSRDEDEAAERAKPPAPKAVHCTCGTMIPCAVWGHS